MEHLVAVMLLVGCNANGSTCSEIPAPVPFFASQAECEAELGLQMRLTHTFDNRVLGACKGVDEALLEQSATIEWAVSRGGQLQFDVVPLEEPANVASLDSSGGAEPQRMAAR